MLKITALLGVRLLSYTGSYIGFLAMNIFILSLGFGPSFLAQVFFIRVMAAIISAPFLGYLSDRWNRKFMMVITDTVMAISVIGLIIIPKNYLSIYIPIFMFIAGSLANVFDVTLNASMPVILDSQDSKKLLKINSWMLGGKHSAIIVSGVFIALSYTIFKSYYVIFLIDALSYILSGTVILFLKIRTNEIRADVKINRNKEKISVFIKSHFKNLLNDYKSMRSVLKKYIVIAGLTLIFAATFSASSLNVAWPVISKLFNKETPMLFYGIIIMAWGLGNVIGIYSTNKNFIYTHGSSSIPKTYLISHAIMAIGMGSTVLMPTQLLAIFAAIFGGIGDGISKNLMVLYAQQFKDSIRGKLFAVANMVNRMGFALGFVFISLTLKLLTIKELTVLFHLLTISIVIAFATLRLKSKKTKIIETLE